MFVYIGTYTNGDSQSEGIYVYDFDKRDGSLHKKDVVKGISNPSFQVVADHAHNLYSVSEVFDADGVSGGRIAAFSIDYTTGCLRLLNTQSTVGGCPCHVAIDQTGRYIFISNYMGGSLVMYPIEGTGQVGELTEMIQHEGGAEVNLQRQEAPHIHSVIMAPDNAFVLAADLGKDEVISYRFDAGKGCLSFSYRLLVSPGAGPRHMAFHPNTKWLFLVNELNSTIQSYRYHQGTGRLDLISSINSLPPEFNGNNIAADIHLHPNGQFLYVSNRGHDSLAICSIDSCTGTLTLLGHKSSGGSHPRSFGIDPAGRFMLVANKDSNQVSTFEIDAQSGMLSDTGQCTDVPEPVCITFFKSKKI
ncbi:MAG: lactonase family protein [Saprospiraceae bacterium]|nr:lactonase family protein [Saprospiraceae bacterium]